MNKENCALKLVHEIILHTITISSDLIFPWELDTSKSRINYFNAGGVGVGRLLLKGSHLRGITVILGAFARLR